MMQETNLSEKNAFCRFAMGTSLTAFGIARVARNPNCTRGRLMIAFGAMKMAEGIFKYCPTKALMGSCTQSAMNNSNSNSNSMQSMFSGQNSMSSEQIDKLMKDFSSAISGNTSGSNATASKQSDSSTSNQNSSESKSSTNKAQNPS
ncbi:YgaP-like transmembrane domain [Lysinibacillus sp. RC79]|uniref:YgaP-like transmembrane domain n=1 Tax=Lysinibacillus sp. RC79 TaxID=3156296 RepID=UPI003512F0B3